MICNLLIIHSDVPEVGLMEYVVSQSGCGLYPRRTFLEMNDDVSSQDSCSTWSRSRDAACTQEGIFLEMNDDVHSQDSCSTWSRSLMLLVEEEDKMNNSSDVASSKGSCGQEPWQVPIIVREKGHDTKQYKTILLPVESSKYPVAAPQQKVQSAQYLLH